MNDRIYLDFFENHLPLLLASIPLSIPQNTVFTIRILDVPQKINFLIIAIPPTAQKEINRTQAVV